MMQFEKINEAYFAKMISENQFKEIADILIFYCKTATEERPFTGCFDDLQFDVENYWKNKNLYSSEDYTKIVTTLWVMRFLSLCDTYRCKFYTKYNKETMFIWYDFNEKQYLSKVPELPGCISDGKTLEEAYTNTLIIIDEWKEIKAEIEKEINMDKELNLQEGTVR